MLSGECISSVPTFEQELGDHSHDYWILSALWQLPDNPHMESCMIIADNRYALMVGLVVAELNAANHSQRPAVLGVIKSLLQHDVPGPSLRMSDEEFRGFMKQVETNPLYYRPHK